LSERIRDARSQPDFTDLRFNPTKVIGLGEADDAERFSDFLVLVRPAESIAADKLDEYRVREAELMSQAFTRQEAGEVRNFDAAIAGEMTGRALFAIMLSWVAIVAYLWFRFGNWRWGLAAVICLVHDVIVVVGIVAVSGWLYDTFLGGVLAMDAFKIDLAMIAAILTVIGYSVNDTIVVFDRIRENRGKLKTVSQSVINRSINQTLSRTVLTSGTTFLVVFIMYVWGGPGIHAFSFALLVGVLFGTYSSVAVASPLLMGFKEAVVARTAAEPAESRA
jgi:SecD/SecF fusion protein